MYREGDRSEFYNKDDMGWHAALMVEIRDSYRNLVGKPERKRSLGRSRR
jgi:hypothetical protein